jgi:hypothetical protein
MIEIREATQQDAVWFATRLRAADKREAIAATGKSPIVALMASVAMGNSFVAEHDGEPVAVFGLPIINSIPRVGVPWLMGTDTLDDIRLTFGLTSVKIIDDWMEQTDEMVNYVDSRHHRAVRWLKWLGFDMGEALPHGPYGVPFRKFTWHRGDAHV